MRASGLNRRELVVGAGALAARAAAPMAVSAGGILLPSMANAATISQSGATVLQMDRTMSGVVHQVTQWSYSSGKRVAFVADKSRNYDLHAIMVHELINNEWYVTKYKGGTILRNRDTNVDEIVTDSTHAHRVLKTRYGRDFNQNGAIDYVPSYTEMNYPSGRTDLQIFDSVNSWGMEVLKFRRYTLNGTTYVKGAVKDINSTLAIRWYGFTLSGANYTEFMNKFNTANDAYTGYKNAHTGVVAGYAMGAVMFCAAAGILLASGGAAGPAIYPAVVGMLGIGALTSVAGTSSWIAQSGRYDTLRSGVSSLEVYCESKKNITYTP